MIPIETKVVGVMFDQCQENIELYSFPAFSRYELQREPDNEHDPNAVRVGVGDIKFGYLPAELAQRIAPMMDSGRRLLAEHVALNQWQPHQPLGLTVRITEITE